MSKFDDAEVLIQHAEASLPKIIEAYESSLLAQDVSPTLLVEIKNLMENLRSALDFSAHAIFDLYGTSSKENPRIYFPYAFSSQTKEEFSRSGRVERCIPGISSRRPDIVALLESYQHCGSEKFEWLPVFMELNNENKHQQLSPQERRESKQLEISSGGTTMTLGAGATMTLGHGATMTMGDVTISGGQEISAENPASFTGQGTQNIITWVSFHFSSNDQLVVPLLQQSLIGVKTIVSGLSAI